MHARRMAPLLLALLCAPAAQAAQAQGDLVSDSPVALHGTGNVAGATTVLHHAFRDGSLTGVTYSGRLVDHVRTDLAGPHQPPECRQLDGQEEDNVLLTVDVAKPEERADFSLQAGSLVRLVLAEDLRFTLDSTPGEPGSAPWALLGPNPYAFQTAQTEPAAQSTRNQVAAFPTDPFLVLPTGVVHTDARHTMEVHWGNLTVHQKDQTNAHAAGEFLERREVTSQILPPPAPPQRTECDVLTVHVLRFEQSLATIGLDQDGLERPQDFYTGRSQLGSPFNPDESAPPIGYWERSQATAFDRALAAYALPSTIVTGSGFHVALHGSAVFTRALGSLLLDGKIHETSNETITIQGTPNLRPNSADAQGRRMSTHVGNEVTHISVQGRTGTSAWAPYAAGAGGTLLLAGVVTYGWPSMKFGATRLLLFPLYARLRKEDILENPLRDDILEVVGGEPGISASELGRRLNCGWGTLVYHLTVLERMQLISSAREGRHKRFFVQGRINYSDKSAVGLLANPAARNILQAIQEHPGALQKEVAARLGLTAGTVAWHVERLAAAGLVLKEEDGRLVRYYPSNRLAELTRQLGA